MNFYRFINIFGSCALVLFSTALISSAQVSTIQGGGLRTQPRDESAERRINEMITSSGERFKEGLLALDDNRRDSAREKFDRAVEVFLVSDINTRASERLNDCYNQLIETVYRIEYPTEKIPQIDGLAATCGWQIKPELVAKITSQSRSMPAQNFDSKTSGTSTPLGSPGDSTVASAGFSEQRFESSPLDELSKIELTPFEQQIENNPVAAKQYQEIQYAVKNKSLGFSFQVHPMIQQYVNYYQGRGRSTMETGLYRSGMFMSMARKIFREEGVPENVVWLGQVESTWKPTALSWAAASGLWQFIPSTGARYGLRRTAYVDERNGFEMATRASARYLKFLANRYGGNWELAMAAYNSGEGNVDRAISRAGTANFWVAYPYLPRETRNYVPNILATILIANNPQQYGFGHLRPAPRLTYDRIRVPASTNLSLIATAADTSLDYIRYLNPEFRTNMTPPEPYVVRVPAGKVNQVYAVLKRIPSSKRNDSTLASVQRGESWDQVANRTGVPKDQLQAMNSGAKQPQGKVIIPKNKVQKVVYQRPSAPVAQSAGSVKVVKAKQGDTVAKIAARNGASALEVAKFNGVLPDEVLAAGREIRILNR